ncbi:MAG TPA: hypothetical protein VND88_04080 [Candidatus Acidoferrales bacterium]|nr:hypothetical protein [Candidatus Acidoferrales bacterium]
MKTRHLLGVPALLAIAIVASMQGVRAGTVQDFTANVSHEECASRPSTATSSSASTPLAGTQYWGIGLTSILTPSSASVTVNSGYSPSLILLTNGFCDGGSPLTGFPAVFTGLGGPSLDSTIALKQAPGFASTATAKPSKIPKGGTKQTVVATFRLTNPALDQQLKLGINSAVPGASLVSASYAGPAGFNILPGSGGVEFTGNNPALNTLYKFTVVLHIPNPYGKAFTYKPLFDFLVIGINSATIDPGPATTETIAVPTLDGGTSGAGSAIFAVSGASGSWELDTAPGFDLQYREAALP